MLVAVGVAACAERERAGSTLTIALPRDVGPLNIYVGANDALLGLVYDKLFEPSPYVMRPEPGLAERAVQVDSVTWVVTLRDDVKWHDGTPFTADDVAFTFAYYRDGPPNRHSHHVSQVPRIDRIDAAGARTVRFVCGYPCPTLERITLADLPILPKHIWERITEPRKYTELPVGTGPYRLVEYTPEQRYRFVANDQYFRGRPLVHELVMPIIPDPSATFIALRTKQIDATVRDLPPELVDGFRRLDRVGVVSTAPLSIVELRPNYERAPFDEPAFRRALSLAVDRDELVRTILLGQGRPGTRGYPHPDSPWTDPSLRTPSDANAARRLLDSLGFTRNRDGLRKKSDGSPLAFTVKVPANEPPWIRAGELLVRQFARVGIRLTLETVDAGVLTKQTGARDYDLFISRIGPHGVADPDQFIMSQRSGYLWRGDKAYPELDSLFAAWKRTTMVETRRQASFAIQRLFNDGPTSIALYYPNEVWAFRRDAYDRWAESPGFGIVHKWSFLPHPARGGTVVREFGPTPPDSANNDRDQ